MLASPRTAEEVEIFLVPDVPSPSKRRTSKAGLTFALRVTEAESKGGRTRFAGQLIWVPLRPTKLPVASTALRRAGNLVVRDSEVPTN